MDDNDKKVTLNDDEFHFTEAEEVQSSPYSVSAEEASDNKPKGITRRKILIAIGILIVALSFYKLISVFFESSSSKKMSVLPSQTMVTTTTTQPALQQINTQATPTPTATPELKNQLSQMQQNDVTTSQQMSTVSEQVSTLNNSVGSLTNQVNSLSQQLQSLTARLQSQQSALTTSSVKAKVKVIVKKYLPPPPPIWYIQAIVPGRAWLIQPNGETTTVRKGDRLAGYGRIIHVSAVYGFVKTSTGAILRFRNL